MYVCMYVRVLTDLEGYCKISDISALGLVQYMFYPSLNIIYTMFKRRMIYSSNLWFIISRVHICRGQLSASFITV